MLRLNRSRVVGIACLLIFIYFLLFTDSGASSSEFRANTEAGLARKHAREQDLPLRGHLSDEDLTRKTNDELQGILAGSMSKEKLAKDEDGNPIGRKYREPAHHGTSVEDLAGQGISHEEPMGSTRTGAGDGKMSHDVEDVSIAGRKKMSKPKYPIEDPEKSLRANADAEDNETEDGGDPGKDFAREKLMEHLKNPVVIFSKSYCPHSKRAKHLLLEVYKIVPTPLVVELDTLTTHIPGTGDHDSKITLGKALQDLLAEITGRKTVPNIVVGGHHSIGGNDKIWEMHDQGVLLEEIKKFGGRKIVSVDVRDGDDDKS